MTDLPLVEQYSFQEPTTKGQKTPYEYLIAENRDRQFDDLSVEEQRDELWSAIGLFIEWAPEALDCQRKSGIHKVLMEKTVDEMGKRYGPWMR